MYTRGMRWETLEPRTLFTTIIVAPITAQESDVQAVFIATLDAPADTDIVLAYRTVNGTARAGADFQPTRSSVVIPAGATDALFNVTLFGDVVSEPTEMFTVTLKAPRGVTLASKHSTAAIIDDDVPPQFILTGAQVFEGATRKSTLAVVNVALTGELEQTVRARYVLTDDTATAADNDYQPARGGVLVFRPGQVESVVRVRVVGDAALEADEVFNVSLISATTADGRTLDTASATASVTILNDDGAGAAPPLVSISVHSPDFEGPVSPFIESVDNRSYFRVDLAAAEGASLPPTPVRVSYATSDGTATAASGDYEPASGVLTFTPGETSKTIFINIGADIDVEFAETFTMTLSNPANCQIANGTATMTIPNDDVAVNPDPPPAPPPPPPVVPAISIQSASQFEGQPIPAVPGAIPGTSTLLVPLTLSVATTVPVDVAYQTQTIGTEMGDATGGVDYAITTGTLRFVAGQTTQYISIAISGDGDVEPDEVFRVIILDPVNATIAESTAVCTIFNDDVAA